jgi:HlyD family secretion protein
MKKWVWRILIPVILVAVFLLYRNLTPQKVEYFVLEPRNVLETIVAAGRVKFSQEVALAFQVPGVVQEVRVKEGDKVRAGDPLITLEDTLERSRTELAKTELALAEINLRRIVEYQRELVQEEYRRATINRQAASDQYQQAQLLFERGSIPEEELKNARRNWETALSLENAARLNMENIREDGPGFLEAKAQVERARLQLSQAETDLQKKSLVAPLDGTITSLSKSPGEFVQAGEVVAVLGKNPFQVVTNVDERQYKKIKPGMKALVSEQANPGKEVLASSIVQVAPAIDAAQGTIEVTLLLDDSAGNVKPNAAVNVEIIIREEQGVLAFPRRYLSGENAVWVEKDGKAHPQTLSDLTFFDNWVKTTELPSGTVLLNPNGLREGKRVTLGERSIE